MKNTATNKVRKHGSEKSNKNLRSISSLPAEERKALCAKGGRKSGEMKRQQKLLREIVKACAERRIRVQTMEGTRETVEYDVAMILSMYRQAILEGNVKAAEFIAKVSGALDEKPETHAGLVIQVSAGLADELKKATE